MLKFTELPEDVMAALAVNAGVLLSDFDPSAGTLDRKDIIGATSGGVNVTCVPEYEDFGEDIDNCPKNTKELKRIKSWECKMSGTMLTIDSDGCRRFLGAADATAATNRITPRAELKQSDFSDLWYVCDYGDAEGGFIAIKLIDALSTGGFSLQTADKGKGKFAFELTGHSSTASISTVPMDFYIKAGAAA